MAGTLDEAFEQAVASLDENINSDGDDDQIETTDDQPETESKEVEELTEEESTETSEETSEDSFSDVKIDELPKELQGIYKSLQGDYTRKTQSLAQARKESEQRISELEKQLQELQSPKQELPKTPQEELQDVIKSQIESTKVAEYRDSAISDYEAADPRLRMDADTYDKPTDLFVGQEMDNRLRQHVKDGKPEYTFNHKEHLAQVLTEWDEYVQSKQKDFLVKQSKKAKESTQTVAKQNPKASNGKGRPKKMSLDEAIEAARQKSL